MNKTLKKVGILIIILIMFLNINLFAVEDVEERLYLTGLSVKDFEFTQNFRKNVYNYTINIDDQNCNSLTIEAIANKSDANIEILGADNIKNGENIINIIVTSKDGNEVKNYQIMAIKKDNILNSLRNIETDKLIAGIIIIVAIFLLIILSINLMIKNKKEKKLDNFENDKSELDEKIKEFKKKRRRKGKH